MNTSEYTVCVFGQGKKQIPSWYQPDHIVVTASASTERYLWQMCSPPNNFDILFLSAKLALGLFSAHFHTNQYSKERVF